ncbi:MAG: DEAD/DEAH box helicase [Nanoarchaeota archaeon]
MIFIDFEKPDFVLSFSGNEFELDLHVVRNLPVREFIKKRRLWIVPGLAVKTIENLRGEWSPAALNAKKTITNNLLQLVDYKFQSNGESNSKLRTYQKIGVNFLVHAKKSLLSDDMGLGKTIQAISALEEMGTQRNLILCPASLKWNWANEFKKHFNIIPTIINGSKKERAELWLSDNKYIVANYDLLSYDWNEMSQQWDAIIADEAVYLKTHSSRRTKLAKKLKSDIRIALSGLPIENNLMDFHSIMEWVRPGILPSYNRFKYRYCKFDYFGKLSGYQNLTELHLLTSPFVLRRKKEDVLTELPPKIYTDCPLELSSSARKAYNALSDDFVQWLRAQPGVTPPSSVLEKLIRMRQFVEFPSIIGFDIPSIKLGWVKELVEGVDKLVVFSYFRDSVELLKNNLKAKYVLTGDTPIEDRVNLIEKFNLEDKGILICSDAGRFGLNITGSDNIVHFGNFFNPAVMVQREDRLHRIGQKNVVKVFNPYIMDTLDEGIRNIFMARKAEADDFMSGNELMSIARLSKEQFIRLVEGEV